MNLVRLNVLGISSSQIHSGAYVLLMGEYKGERHLPIVIGGFEAQSITMAIEKNLTPSRPLTHDLFENFARRFDIEIKQVIIHKLVEGIFYSNIICERNGIEDILDARNSDAIALAIRFDAPIYTNSLILDKAGVVSEEEASSDSSIKSVILENKDDKKIVPRKKDNLKQIDSLRLRTMLEEAIRIEHYEEAALIRDEINRRTI